MTTPSIILGRVVQLNAALFQIMMVSNIFLKMWVIYYHRLIMPNTAAGWHLLPEVGWREPEGFALSVEQFLGRNFAAGPAFLPEPWEVFRSLQRAGCTWFSPVSGRIDGYTYLSLFRDHKSSFSSHGGSWAGEAQLNQLQQSLDLQDTDTHTHGLAFLFKWKLPTISPPHLWMHRQGM